MSLLTLGEISLSKDDCAICTESTASDESAINGATSNEDIVDSSTSPLSQEKVRLLYDVYSDITMSTPSILTSMISSIVHVS